MQKNSVINLWGIASYVVLVIFVLPILIVISSIFGEWSENWSHLYEYVLFDYIYNSSVLVIGVLFFAFILGTTSAWLVTSYQFPGKDLLEWALILPLAIPSYILAYTFTGLFDTYGTVNIMMRDLLSLEENISLFPNVRNLYGAIIVFSFTLYPYVYLVTRSAFLNQSQSMLEAGRLLGLNNIQIFYKLGIPIIRPAIIGGLMLVAMETLSDFGAVEHFAIQTFTTGIFRTWYGMYDIETAMQFASMLLVFVGLFVMLEKYTRDNAKYTSKTSTYKPKKLKNLTGHKGFLVLLFVFFLFLSVLFCQYLNSLYGCSAIT